jgi:hypothetical protein
MTSHLAKLTLILLAGILAAVAALIIFVPSADAVIIGTPLPPVGSNWVMDQNTTVLGESIALNGSIIVTPGWTLQMKNTVVKFNCVAAGQYGVQVPTASGMKGVLNLTSTTFKAADARFGWTFTINGDANLSGDVDLLNVHNGVYIYSSTVVFDDVNVQGQGTYGMYISSCSPTIVNCAISNLNDVVGVWSGTSSTPKPATGLYVAGASSSVMAAPKLDKLTIKVKVSDTWDNAVTAYQIYEYIYAYGLDTTYANLGVLSNITVTFEIVTNANMRYSGTSTYLYFYDYTYVYGMRFQTGTLLDGFNNVAVDTSTYVTNAKGSGFATGYFYNYFYFYGLYNTISSAGRVPTVITGLTFRGHHMTYNLAGFGTIYNYFSGQVIYWQPTTAAPVGGYIFDGIKFLDLDVGYMYQISNSWDFTMRYCTVDLCNFGGSTTGAVLYLSSQFNFKVTVINNTFTNNKHGSGYLFYLYYSNGDVLISGNKFVNNQWYYLVYTYQLLAGKKMLIKENLFSGNSFTGYMFYIYYPYGALNIESNRFTNNRWSSYGIYSYYFYGAVTFFNNTFDGNTGSSYFMYNGYVQAAGSLTFKANKVVNNTFMYGAYIVQNYGPVYWNDNIYENNRVTGASYGLLYTYYPYATTGTWEIKRNRVHANTLTDNAFVLYYLGQYKSTVTFESNDFVGNTGNLQNLNSGLVYLYYLYQDQTIANNYFEGNSINCICNYYSYSNSGAYTFSVISNEFINNSGKCIVFSDIDNMKLRARANHATQNSGYSVYLEQVTKTINGPDAVYIEDNNFTNNPGGGIFLRTCAYDPATGTTYGNPTQDIMVKGNLLNDNGAGGWALAVVGVYKSPTLRSNDWTGSAMGLYLGLINDDSRRVPFTFMLRNTVVDGDTDGVSAYGFENLDAEFYYCTISNFTEAIYAKDCTVTVWWSAVPEAGGRTEGKGRIYVYNHFELYATWASADGVDSGNPAEGATVAIQGANSKYLNPFKTDAEGRYGPVVMSPWSCIEGVMDAWAPFEVSVSKGNVSTTQQAHFIGELVFPESPMHILLVDSRIPEVIISNPQDGTLVNSSDVHMDGILFEVGSGIHGFEAQTDLMASDKWVDIQHQIFWDHVVPGLTEGNHWIKVRATDLAGNVNLTTVNFIVDLSPPQMDVWIEYKNSTRLQGPPYFVQADEIVINGTYYDNFAALADIAIRVNGVRLDILPADLGNLYAFMGLSQGLNILRLDATDTAENRASMEAYIWLDNYGPVLYVYSPLQSESTPSRTLHVTGLTERDTPISVTVTSTAGSTTRSTISLGDGNFTLDVGLIEGNQRVIVVATDAAGNEVMVTRDIVCDTTPPEFEFTNPASGLNVVTNLTQYTVKGRMTLEAGAELYIDGQLVANPGIFERTIVLLEGRNVVEVKAIDKVGNVRLILLTIERDTVGPQLHVVAPASAYVLTQSATVRFAGTSVGADRTGGGVTVEYRGNQIDAVLVSGDWQGTATWQYELTLRAEDLDQYIVVRAKDAAGNEESWTCHVVYDVIAPSLSVNAIPTTTEDPEVLIDGMTDEEVATVYINGVPYPVETGLFTVKWSLVAGRNTITIEVRDEAGNVRTDTREVLYEHKEYVPPTPVEVGGETNFNLWSVMLLVVAVTIILVALYVYFATSKKEVK